MSCRRILLNCKTLSTGGVGLGSSMSSTIVSIQTTQTTARSTYSLQLVTKFQGVLHLSILTWPPAPTQLTDRRVQEKKELIYSAGAAKQRVLERVGFPIRPLYAEFVWSVHAFTLILIPVGTCCFVSYCLYQLCQTSLQMPKTHL